MVDEKRGSTQALLEAVDGAWSSQRVPAEPARDVEPSGANAPAGGEAQAEAAPGSTPTLDALDAGWIDDLFEEGGEEDGEEDGEQDEEDDASEPELPDEAADPEAYAAARKARDERAALRREKRKAKADAKKARRKARAQAAQKGQKQKSKSKSKSKQRQKVPAGQADAKPKTGVSEAKASDAKAGSAKASDAKASGAKASGAKASGAKASGAKARPRASVAEGDDRDEGGDEDDAVGELGPRRRAHARASVRQETPSGPPWKLLAIALVVFLAAAAAIASLASR